MKDIVLKASRGRVRLAILAFYFMQGLCFASWASRIPNIKSALGMNDATLGTVLFAIPMGQLLAMPFAGYIVSRFGSVRSLQTVILIHAVILVCIGFSASVWTLGLFLFLFGFTGNFLNISVNTQGIYIEDYYGRPIMASFHGGWSIAGFLGALLGLLAVNLHFEPSIHFIGILGIICVIYIINFKYLFPDVKKESVSGKKKNKGFPKPEKLLILLGIVGFCGMASEGVMFDWSGVYFKDIVQAPEKLVTVGYTAFMIMMAFGRFIADKLIVKFGRKRLLQICGIMISTGLYISVLFPNIFICIFSFMMIGMGVSSVIPIVYSVAGNKSKVSANIALVIVSSISFFGFLIGPPVIGYIAELFNLRYSFAFIGLFGICITILVSWISAFGKK